MPAPSLFTPVRAGADCDPRSPVARRQLAMSVTEDLGRGACFRARRARTARQSPRQRVRSAQLEREVVLSDDRREAEGRVKRECAGVLDVDFQADPARAISA
jgi:hypothetical protein